MKTEKKKTLRGSVLFTVVCVMALLIIFLTGTLALASAAGNRAHRSYSTSQANYTARAAIESFTTAMQRDERIVAAVQSVGTDPTVPSLHPQVIINDKTLGEIGYWDTSGNWVPDHIEITPVPNADTYAYYDKKGDGTLDWYEVQTVKISATCKVGKEFETVSAYIQKSPSKQTPRNPGGIQGLQEVGGNTFANGAYITGGLGVGIGSSAADVYHFHNDATVETTLTYVNSSLCGGTSSFKINVKKPDDPDAEKPYSQTVIDGNLLMENNSFVVLDYEMPDDYTQKEVPYLFINGMLTQDQQSGLNLVRGNNSPFNVFIGTLNPMGPISINGDLYLMDQNDGSTITAQYVNREGNRVESKDVTAPKGINYFGKPNQGGKLYEWTKSVVQRTDTQFNSSGGSIYCMGDLNLANATIRGDVRVEGNCNIDNGVTIYGDLVVKGNLTFNNQNANRIVRGKIYNDSHSGDESKTQVMKPGFTYHENELFPGYIEVGNYIFDNTEVPDIEEQHETKMNHDPWHNEMVYPDGTVEDLEWGTKTIYVKKNTTEWYNAKPYYATYVDDAGNGYDDTNKIVYSDKTIFKANPDGSVKFDLDGDGNPRLDPDGRKIGITTDKEHTYYKAPEALGDDYVEVEEDDAKGTYYTKEGDSKRYGVNEVYENVGTANYNSYASYGQPAYPTNMTREKIWGSKNAAGVFEAAPSETKIIKTLKEVRESLNYDDDGEYDPDIYYTEVPEKYLPVSGDQSSLPYAYVNGAHNTSDPQLWSSGAVTKSCILGNSEDPSSAFSLPETFTIHPYSEMWVVLQRVDMDFKEIVVDRSNGANGKVNFLVVGTNKLNGSSIRSSECVNGTKVKYDKEWGMEFFAAPGATLDMTNPCTITGTFKAPELTISNKVAGKYKIDYEDEYGNITTNIEPVIVGSALVSSVTDAQNKFSVLNSGNGGKAPTGTSFDTALGRFELMYYMGV